MLAFLKRILNPDDGHLANLLAEHAASVVTRTEIVRDGIAFIFEEHKSGVTFVHATRRIKPYKHALFRVESKSEAIAWCDDGLVPPGETSDLLKQLQVGTWPMTHSVDDI